VIIGGSFCLIAALIFAAAFLVYSGGLISLSLFTSGISVTGLPFIMLLFGGILFLVGFIVLTIVDSESN
jgi:uncharacterized membrane protein YgdD (TMEM256/DUF423 family)